MPLDKLIGVGLFSLDTSPVFDRVVETASRLMDCEVSLISLIDEPKDRQFFKAQAGLPPPWSELRETPLSSSFCKFVVAQQAPLAVEDARLDARFAANRAVYDLGAVAYLGIPLRDDVGTIIGALCVFSTSPRAWTSEDIGILTALAEGVSVQIGLMLASYASELSRPQDQEFEDFVALDNRPGAELTFLQGPDGQEAMDFLSGDCERIWDVSPEEFKARFTNPFAMCLPGDLAGVRASLGDSAARLTPWHHEWRILAASGAIRRLSGYGHPEAPEGGGIKWQVVVRDVTA